MFRNYSYNWLIFLNSLIFLELVDIPQQFMRNYAVYEELRRYWGTTPLLRNYAVIAVIEELRRYCL